MGGDYAELLLARVLLRRPRGNCPRVHLPRARRVRRSGRMVALDLARARRPRLPRHRLEHSQDFVRGDRMVDSAGASLRVRDCADELALAWYSRRRDNAAVLD